MKKVVIIGASGFVGSAILSEALERGFRVTILKDCCGARKKGDFDTAIRELEKAGCRITTYETLVYQMMRSSRHTAFRRISEIVKE